VPAVQYWVTDHYALITTALWAAVLIAVAGLTASVALAVADVKRSRK
jgi:short subunit fatty acids transporter